MRKYLQEGYIRETENETELGRRDTKNAPSLNINMI